MAPAAANYYTPPTHPSQKQRGYRICDTCGAVETPTAQKFRLCGGCVSATLTPSLCPRLIYLLTVDYPVLREYLRDHAVIRPSHLTPPQSPECQKSHWPSHKVICQHTAAQLSGVKQQPISTAYPDENLAKYLRRFTSTHASLLGWAGFQALQLKRIPANIRQNALLIELSYNPHGESLFRCVSSWCTCMIVFALTHACICILK